MPALTVLGQRLGFVAGDDLRAIAKFNLVLRTAQLVILWTAFVLLIMAEVRLHDDQDMWSSTTCIQDERQKEAVVWSFWALSATTIVSSIVLESFMWVCVSSESSLLICLCSTDQTEGSHRFVLFFRGN